MPLSDPTKRAAYDVRYKAEHRAETSKRMRDYYAAHRGELLLQMKLYRSANSENIRKRKSEYHAAHLEEQRRYRAIYYILHRKEFLDRMRRLKELYPERSRAREAVHTAVRYGKLIRPEHCSRCGVQCKPDGHHHNGYAREHWLDVVWLCRRCHKHEEHQ